MKNKAKSKKKTLRSNLSGVGNSGLTNLCRGFNTLHLYLSY